jgi:diadenylate cyclase
MRHRAGLGLAGKTDAVVIIVSEETGEISLAYDAEIFFTLSPQKLEEELRKLFSLV